MKKKATAKYETRAQVLKALAHPTRLMLIDELAKRECNVLQMTEMIGDDISTISKHLAVLKKVGIVQANKRGLQVWYSLKIPCVLNFFGCVEDVLKTEQETCKKRVAT